MPPGAPPSVGDSTPTRAARKDACGLRIVSRGRSDDDMDCSDELPANEPSTAPSRMEGTYAGSDSPITAASASARCSDTAADDDAIEAAALRHAAVSACGVALSDGEGAMPPRAWRPGLSVWACATGAASCGAGCPMRCGGGGCAMAGASRGGGAAAVPVAESAPVAALTPALALFGYTASHVSRNGVGDWRVGDVDGERRIALGLRLRLQ